MGFDLRLERLIDAPREKVFEAWSKPEHVRHWFTPQPLGTGECRLDFREGGEWVHTMLMPGGAEHTRRARYTELRAPERLVFEAGLKEEPGSHIVTTVTFDDEGGRTRLRVRQVFDGPVPKEDAERGWNLTLDQLTARVLQRLRP
jgi:uncharacterized protein YndB with AHSA1/START domain